MVLPTVVVSMVSVSMMRQCTGMLNAMLFGTTEVGDDLIEHHVCSKPLGVRGATRPACSRRSMTLSSSLQHPLTRSLQRSSRPASRRSLFFGVFHFHAHAFRYHAWAASSCSPRSGFAPSGLPPCHRRGSILRRRWRPAARCRAEHSCASYRSESSSANHPRSAVQCIGSVEADNVAVLIFDPCTRP